MKGFSSSRGGHSSYTHAASNVPPSLLDKLDMRRSTPDSEALASSDDEPDTKPQQSHLPLQKTVRRSSWLSEGTPMVTHPRTSSFTNSVRTSSTSQPGTPQAEAGPWQSQPASANILPSSRLHSNSASFPWGGGIWNASDGRKEPPSRLTEVLSTSTAGTASSHANGSYLTSSRETAHLPFSIPLHPTPKTYRSQSYSVGQLEGDAAQLAANPAQTAFTSRGRGTSSAFQHKPSRPSMLSEIPIDAMSLSNVKEVEDDDNSSEAIMRNVKADQNRSRLEDVAQQKNAPRRHFNPSDTRARTQSSNSHIAPGMYASAYDLRNSVVEESDYAIDEFDDNNDLHDISTHNLSRRLSEYAAGNAANPLTSSQAENRKLDHVKKGYWQSSLGFGGLEDIPQSRRHSFADVPTRAGSIVSTTTDSAHDLPALDRFQEQQHQYPDLARYTTNDNGEQSSISFVSSTRPDLYLSETSQSHAVNGGPPYLQNPSAVSTYFKDPPNVHRGMDMYGGGAYPAPVYNAYAPNTQYGIQRPRSPHRGMYGIPQPSRNQPLYIVLFKCSRADVFYVQEDTGLSIKPGDLVIVEADRGTDLGTVALDNVEWNRAREMKEYYAEEHYKWLMMYSQGAANSGSGLDGTGAGLMAASNGMQGSAVGGMGPPGQHGMQEPLSGELKPKIIKRLAQAHEVQALREKEGNEAKAKRVCMQKVKEHGLHMEILDAEFQMDWKKLTFYYFADAYINFNSLVTDLFKIYKTRIWMSAINPASFATSNLTFQAPSGIGPGAVGSSRAPPKERERRPLQEYSSYLNASQGSREFAANRSGFGGGNNSGAPEATPYANAYAPAGMLPSYNYGLGGGARSGAAGRGSAIYPITSAQDVYNPYQVSSQSGYGGGASGHMGQGYGRLGHGNGLVPAHGNGHVIGTGNGNGNGHSPDAGPFERRDEMADQDWLRSQGLSSLSLR